MALLPACSTLAEETAPEGCIADTDCPGDEVCSLAQGGVCLPKELPRRAVLAFDLEDDDFAMELRGCDAEISPVDLELRVKKRDQLGDLFSVSAASVRPTIDCADCTLEQCSDGGSTCNFDLEGTFRLVQPSRIGLGPTESDATTFPVVDEMMEPTGELVTFEWPHYDLSNPDSSAPVVVEVAPTTPGLARFFHPILRPSTLGEYQLDISTRLDCHRSITGTARRFGTESVLEQADISLVYADSVAPVGIFLETDSSAMTCDDDADCPGDRLVCNEDLGMCGLDLEGTQSSLSTVNPEDAGVFDLPTYIYCEDGEVDTRDYVVEVRPAEESGLPRMRYQLTQPFAKPFVGQPVQSDPLPNDLDLCVPSWPTPQPIEVPIESAPVPLLTTSQGVYECCSTDCLPLGEDPADPPGAPDDCNDIARELSITAPVEPPDPVEWLADGCLPVAIDDDGAAGTFNTGATCETSPCALTLSADSEGTARSYEVVFDPPPSSVFRSKRYTIAVDATTTTVPPLVLEPRVIVRGAVRCVGLDDSCTPLDAQVLAERIRMPDEEDALEPFILDTRATSDGSFSLPVNPGVYLMTVLPAAGSSGGPSRFYIHDFREGTSTSEVSLVAGVPVAEISDPLEIRQGLPVSIQLRDFDTASLVTPYDIGSWFQQADFFDPAGRVPDLNDPSTCYSAVSDTQRGCLIRSLVRQGAGGVSLFLSLKAQFTARDRGERTCPGALEGN